MGSGTNGRGRKESNASHGARPAASRATLTFVFTALAALSFSTGCVKVAAYERQALAHPTMSAEDVSSALDEHVRAVSEGASGSLGAAGGGCGCN